MELRSQEMVRQGMDQFSIPKRYRGERRRPLSYKRLEPTWADRLTLTVERGAYAFERGMRTMTRAIETLTKTVEGLPPAMILVNGRPGSTVFAHVEFQTGPVDMPPVPWGREKLEELIRFKREHFGTWTMIEPVDQVVIMGASSREGVNDESR